MSPRAWLSTLVIALVFWGIFLGSLWAAGAFGSCRTHRCWHRVSVRRHERWLRVHRPWVWRWEHLKEWEREWARCVAHWETFGVPWSRKATVDTGNHYQGATQWLTSTWHMAGGSGEPKYHSLHEQLVRTVWWAHRKSPRQWSTSARCGW